MLRSAASKVMWVGRATVFLVGLAVIIALLLGVATTAVGADFQSFILGKANNTATKPTGLVSTLADATKAALTLTNRSGGPALALKVGNTSVPANEVAPMKVNSNKVVTNLNADLVDGQEASAFAPSSHAHSDADITGTVGEAKIDAAIARDAEVMDTVKANDGEQSGLDADLLDGKNSTAFVEQGNVMYAVVQAGGGVWSSATTPGTTASRSATGTYTVTFPNITAANCAFTYGLEGGSFGFIRSTTDGNTLNVYTANTSGTLTDHTFNVIARCS